VNSEPSAPRVLPPPPRHRRKSNAIGVGIVMGVVGLLGVPAFLVAAVLTANPCGPFGDQCESYGQTSDIAVAFLYGMLLSGALAIAGVVVATAGLISRRRVGFRS
jgi:hypothetical protein